jgi:hypothetical protein
MIKAAIYRVSDGLILRHTIDPPEAVELQAFEGEEFYLNCPLGATHIIDNAPVTIGAPPPTLEETKLKKWEEIKKARDGEELSGFDYLGKRFDSDSAAIRRISIAVQAAQVAPEFSIEWTCQGSSTITLNKSQMVQIPITMALRGDAIHQKARALKTQIELAGTVEEVEAISWD